MTATTSDCGTRARRSEPRAVIALYDVYILHCGRGPASAASATGGARWVARMAIAEDIETFAYEAPIATAAVAKLPGPSPLSLYFTCTALTLAFFSLPSLSLPPMDRRTKS